MIKFILSVPSAGFSFSQLYARSRDAFESLQSQGSCSFSRPDILRVSRELHGSLRDAEDSLRSRVEAGPCDEELELEFEYLTVYLFFSILEF